MPRRSDLNFDASPGNPKFDVSLKQPESDVSPGNPKGDCLEMDAMCRFIRFQSYGLRILPGPMTIIIPQPSQVDSIIEHRLLP